MKNFLREFFASCFGTIIGIGALVLIIFAIVLMSSPGDPKTKANSILHLTFSKPVPELTNNNDKSGSSFDFENLFDEQIGLHDILQLIEIAQEDDNIKGIYLDLKGAPGGFATMKKIREALDQFKASGKFVMAYSNAFSQRQYYLASAAEKVYIHPMGGIDFMGFSGQIMYYKGLMDKLGVKAQIYYAGKFKSATEPFRRTDMSPENRKQVSEYIGGAYRQYLEVIGKSRNIRADSLFGLANNARIRNADDAVKYGLADATKYKDEIIDELRERVGIQDDKKKKLQLVSLDKYYKTNKKSLSKVKKGDKVAVVFAEGSIVDGEGSDGSIGGERYARIIRKIRKDDKVKAIVMRVNSGGGSALASEIIWRELEKAKEQGIKVVTSMGDVAASGGYYIAANSDSIFAESNTITGSIGVFGMIPNLRGLYEDKLGLTMDTVKTGRFSTMSSDMGQFYEFTDEEGAIITQSIEEIYDLFKTRVSEGRGLPREHVDSIAQGRVYLGKVAQDIGLVDHLGGLDRAVACAAGLANLEDYRMVSYPKVKSFEESLMSSLQGDKVELDPELIRQELIQMGIGEDFYEVFKMINEVKQMKGPQMRMPYEIIIE